MTKMCLLFVLPDGFENYSLFGGKQVIVTMAEYLNANIIELCCKCIKNTSCNCIISYEPTIRKKYEHLLTTIFDNEKTIVIYPEIVKGNPLIAKNVIRWMLKDDFDTYLSIVKQCKKTNHPKLWSNEDVIIYYYNFNNMFKHMQKIPTVFSIIAYPTEWKEIVKRSLQNEKSCPYEERSKNICVMFKKYVINKKTINNLSIPNTTTIQNVNNTMLDGMEYNDLINAFLSHKYFYCYDIATFYIYIASVCGCIVVIPETMNMKKDEYFTRLNNEYPPNIAYGLDDLEYAIETRSVEKAIDHVDRIIIESKTNVNNILNDLYDHFIDKKKLLTCGEYYDCV